MRLVPSHASRSVVSLALPLALVLAGSLSFSTACSSTTEATPAPAVAKITVASQAALGQGRRVRLPLTVEGTTTAAKLVTSAGITAEIDGKDLVLFATYDAPKTGTVMVEADTARAEIAVSIAAFDWAAPVKWSTGQGPAAREHGTFFEDDDARVAYLLQGSGYSPQNVPLAENWAYSMKDRTWTPWTPTGDVPEPAGSRRSAHAPGKKVHYMFGGYAGAAGDTDASPDLYRVDLGNPAKVFSKLTNATPPPPGRSLHAVGFDEEDSRFVLFGGYSYTKGLLQDTWIGKISGDTVTWTEVTGDHPSARYGTFYAFDAENRKLVVWSGAQKPKGSDQVNAAQDAWMLDLWKNPPVWSEIPLGDSAPPGRRNGCGIFDQATRRLFVFGGTKDARKTEEGLFALDLGAKEPRFLPIDRQAQPSVRSSGFGFVDKTAGDVYCGFGNDIGLYMDLNAVGYTK